MLNENAKPVEELTEQERIERVEYLWKAGKRVEDLVEIFKVTYAQIRKDLAKAGRTDEELKLPKAQLTGQDGNVFNLIGICSRALKGVGRRKEAEEMTARIFKSQSYDEALQIMMDYCETN